MKLISISGLDGSGKTSQVNYLKDYLEDHGKTVHRFHAIQFSIANKLVGIFRGKYAGKDGGAKTSAGKLSIFLRKIALIVDVIRFRRLYNKLKNRGVDYVLADRFFHDQMINILYLDKSGEFDDNKWWQKLVENNIVAPDHALFLDVVPRTILLRKKHIEQGRDYLERKHKLYEDYANARSLRRIDGERSRNDVLDEIKNIINAA